MTLKQSFLLFWIFSIPFISVSQKELTNELIWASSEFSMEYIYSVRSMNDGEHFTALEKNIIVKYSYKNFGESSEVILDANTLEVEDGSDIEIDDYFFNADESKVLLATKMKSIYRRSFTATYYVVDLKTKKTVTLSSHGQEQLADFSPDGTKVAYVYENNIYIFDLESQKTTQVTQNGKKNNVINGGTDWVYEEEFELTKGFYWSPDNQYVAYYSFDESQVPQMTMDFYQEGTYPEPYTFKYPKAGEDNSVLSLWMYQLSTHQSTKMIENDEKYEYFPRVKWTENNELCILAMNRHQSQLDYLLVNPASSTKNKVIYTDRSDTYVEVDNNLIFLSDGNHFLRTSEKDGYNHIYKVGFDGSETQLTKGEWDVVDLKGVNEKNGLVYFISAQEGAMYKSLYTVDLKGKKINQLSVLKGSNDAEFSQGMKYYINYYSNANQPYLISLHDAKGKELKVLKDNETLKNTLKKYELSQKEFITIQGAETNLNAWVIKPKNFDPNKKYPVYFNIYNGPGHNTVVDAWEGRNYLYHQLLAQKGYIVVSVDTRGTMYRGAQFKKSTYLQLGKLETEDMVAVAKEMAKLPYVDAERIGVQGWSYGGYMTSLCMTKGADVFKMGIAVAPVTNWRWYDNIYTERFMRTPQENASGYDDNSPINHVDKLKGKYFIIHGTGDDNVHVQNTYEMTAALVAKNIDFDMMIYTNKNHGIYGGYTRLHLFNKLLNYTLQNL